MPFARRRLDQFMRDVRQDRYTPSYWKLLGAVLVVVLALSLTWSFIRQTRDPSPPTGSVARPSTVSVPTTAAPPPQPPGTTRILDYRTEALVEVPLAAVELANRAALTAVRQESAVGIPFAPGGTLPVVLEVWPRAQLTTTVRLAERDHRMVFLVGVAAEPGSREHGSVGVTLERGEDGIWRVVE